MNLQENPYSGTFSNPVGQMKNPQSSNGMSSAGQISPLKEIYRTNITLPTDENEKNYYRKVALGLGVGQILAGIASIALGITAVCLCLENSCGTTYNMLGYGIWSGAMFIISGSIGAATNRKKLSNVTIIAFMATSICSACLSTVILVFGVMDGYYRHYVVSGHPKVDFSNYVGDDVTVYAETQSSEIKRSIGMALAAIGIVEGVLAILSSILCCRMEFRSSKKSNKNLEPKQAAYNPSAPAESPNSSMAKLQQRMRSQSMAENIPVGMETMFYNMLQNSLANQSPNIGIGSSNMPNGPRQLLTEPVMYSVRPNYLAEQGNPSAPSVHFTSESGSFMPRPTNFPTGSNNSFSQLNNFLADPNNFMVRSDLMDNFSGRPAPYPTLNQVNYSTLPDGMSKQFWPQTSQMSTPIRNILTSNDNMPGQYSTQTLPFPRSNTTNLANPGYSVAQLLQLLAQATNISVNPENVQTVPDKRSDLTTQPGNQTDQANNFTARPSSNQTISYPTVSARYLDLAGRPMNFSPDPNGLVPQQIRFVGGQYGQPARSASLSELPLSYFA